MEAANVILERGEPPLKKRMGRPVGAVNKLPLKVKEKRIETEEQRRKHNDMRNRRRARNTIIDAAKVLKTIGVGPVVPADILTHSTPEQVEFLTMTMGGDAEKVRNMDKAQRIAMYIGAKTYEHIHVHFLRRKKSTLFAKFEQFMLNQAQLLCSGHAVVRLEQQFHRRLRENVMSPARISWLQDMIQSSSLNMCAI